MKKKNSKMSLSAFNFSEEKGIMLGGFGLAIGDPVTTANIKGTNQDCHVTNNCKGANCWVNCGGY